MQLLECSGEKLLALAPALIVPGMAPLSGRPSLALPWDELAR
jgi:hypothetical protein